METMTLTRRRGSDGNLRTLSTALELLDCFESTGELGVSELARRLGVAKSTTHRVLTTLISSGLIEQNPETGQYRLGLHLLELGQLTKRRLRLRRAALPLLEQLRQRTGHTVHLAVPEGPDVVYVGRLVSMTGVQLFADLPHRLPDHCTSAGKVIAAFNPDFARLRETAGFPARTPQTIRKSADWQKTLKVVRGQGIAFSQDEASIGITSVAAPVRDYSGRACAAISITSRHTSCTHRQRVCPSLVLARTTKRAGPSALCANSLVAPTLHHLERRGGARAGGVTSVKDLVYRSNGPIEPALRDIASAGYTDVDVVAVALARRN